MPSVWVYFSEVEGSDIDIHSAGDFLELPATPAGDIDALQCLFSGTKALADYMSCAQDAPPTSEVSRLAGVIERIDAITVLQRRTPIGPTQDLVEPEVGTAKRQPVRRLGGARTDRLQQERYYLQSARKIKSTSASARTLVMTPQAC